MNALAYADVYDAVIPAKRGVAEFVAEFLGLGFYVVAFGEIHDDAELTFVDTGEEIGVADVVGEEFAGVIGCAGAGIIAIGAADGIEIADGEGDDGGAAIVAFAHCDGPFQPFDEGFAVGGDGAGVDINQAL